MPDEIILYGIKQAHHLVKLIIETLETILG